MSAYPVGLTLPPETRTRAGYTEPVPIGAPKSRLFKSHRFDVRYPDGTTGFATYERLAPVQHRFRFYDADKHELPRQYYMERLIGGPRAVEQVGQKLTDLAFSEAVERERKEYFARVTPPTDGSRKPDPTKYRMTAGKAKKLGGSYALCIQVGTRLLPVGPTYARLEEANTAWKVCGKNDIYVACCNRLDRCWELPRYNPLYAEGHPRKEWDHA